ncbi:unnamed protein product [Brassica rapa]|uniref:Uncharacterized protein n=1 Tax=Brassica campestris TaxID=3711 RepID=A0A8D9HPE3_BRACM|nr:unnamed protein product [Brassica rapa]
MVSIFVHSLVCMLIIVQTPTLFLQQSRCELSAWRVSLLRWIEDILTICLVCFLALHAVGALLPCSLLTFIFGPLDKDKEADKDAEFKVNWKRVAITSMFGLGFVGPVGHFWYEGLDKFIKLKLRYVPKSTRFVAAKVAMDGLIFGPIDLLVFFTYMGYATGKNTSEVKEGLKRDFLPALALEGGAWPLLQIANFRYVPVQYQLLYVNIFCLIDSAFLSWVDQQKDAAWKQWFTTPFLTLKERGGTDGV